MEKLAIGVEYYCMDSILIGLDSTRQKNLLFFVCCKAIESKPVKPKTRHTALTYCECSLVDGFTALA